MPEPRHPTIAERADAIAKASGLYRLTLIDPRRRHFRWLPIATLALATVGLGVMLVRRDLYHVGYELLMIGFGVGTLYPIFGPLRPVGHNYKADEREASLRIMAYFVAFGTAFLAAVLGLFALAASALLERWTAEQLAHVTVALAFYLMALFIQVPTLYASWATRPIESEDEA